MIPTPSLGVAVRYRWDLPPEQQEPMAKRPRTARFLKECLLPLPDPNTVPKPEDLTGTFKTEATVTCLESRHKEQRRRLLERHISQSYYNFKSLDDLIDPSHLPTLQSHPTATSPTLQSHFFPESLTLLSSPAAAASLRRLPAKQRLTLVSMDQLHHGKDKDNENSSAGDATTTTELAATAATANILTRREMLHEELELRLHQFETKKLFYEALMRSAPDKYGQQSIGGGVSGGSGSGITGSGVSAGVAASTAASRPARTQGVTFSLAPMKPVGTGSVALRFSAAGGEERKGRERQPGKMEREKRKFSDDEGEGHEKGGEKRRDVKGAGGGRSDVGVGWRDQYRPRGREDRDKDRDRERDRDWERERGTEREWEREREREKERERERGRNRERDRDRLYRR